MRNLISGVGAVTVGLALPPELSVVVVCCGLASIYCWIGGKS